MSVDLAKDPRRQNALNPPRLRGVLHTWCVPASILAGIALIAVAPTPTARTLGGIFAVAVTVMFTASAIFHRRAWTDMGWWRMRQVDQTAIYLMMAGSYTGMAGLTIAEPWRTRLLVAVWIATLLGIAMVWLPFRIPFGLNTAIYVGIGAMIVPRLGELADTVGSAGMTLILAGLALYFIGGLALGARVPNPIPDIFGYHEVWHLLVTIAVILHYCAVYFVIFPKV